ncbi:MULTISPECIES: preprotein translocase subunit YajC [Desulfolithobacter]|uniref:Sec translocon accessory complex subunit YajC n=1 Tax=Desulfolithobacter dissulfuricans TaxID=2795293 RepID=A0A915U3D5_9BACT|nr:preprotein translocase subunit YajC [Desulfolithobacter dissulfuricans]BCO10538.1 preprotein translocase subunit YajC [Desulfolithobacter dissulfuricans]
MTGIAYAAGGAPAAGPAGGLASFVPLILIFVIFYFLLIRPQQKKAKQHQIFLNNLKKGDEVVTSGGIFGKITGLTDTVVTLEIADGVRIKVTRASILASAADTRKQAEAPAKGG